MITKKRFIKACALCLIVISSLYSEKLKEKPFAYCIGIAASVETRTATRAITDIDFEHDYKLPITLRPTIILGRHFYPVSWFRIEILGEYSFSKAENDTVVDFSTLKKYKAGGADLNIHLVKRVNPSFGLFAGVGGGFLITSVKAEDNEQGYGGFKIRNSSPVLNIDAGCEIVPMRKTGFSISYLYRFWRPTRFTDDRDMPLQGTDYKELVHSHGLVLKLLVGKK